MSRLLAASTILVLPNIYILEKSLKRINITVLWLYFLKTIFQDMKEEGVADAFVSLNNSKMMPTSVFHDYYYWRKKLKSYSFYDYINVISCVKYNTRYKDNILLDNHLSNFLSKIQQSSTTLEYNTLVAFIRPLSTKENIEYSIKRGHPETDALNNNSKDFYDQIHLILPLKQL